MLYEEDITASLSNGNESVGYHNGDISFNKLRSDPNYFVRSGIIYNATLYDSSTGGDYWSNVASSDINAYYLFFNSAGVYPARNYSRNYGRSVRCVAR